MRRSSTAHRSPPLAAVLALFVTFGVAAATFVFAVGDVMRTAVTPDLPWILAAGNHILAEYRLPVTDLFSWSHSDAPWVLYQWLFEVVVAAGESWLGLEILVRILFVLIAAIYVFLPALFALSNRVPLLLVLLPACAALTVATYNLSLRPMVVTALFLLIQYIAIDRLSRGRSGLPAAAVLLAVLYALWGNMHMGVFLGLVSLALCLAGDLLQRRRIYPFDPADRDVEGGTLGAGSYLLLLAVAFLASLCNAYGLGIYRYLFDLSGDGWLNEHIFELQALDFHKKRPALFMVMAVIFMLSLMRATRIYTARELLHLFVFTLWAFVVSRFIVWGALFYALILPKALYQLWTSCETQEGPVMDMVRFVERHRRRVLVGLVALSLFLVVLVPLRLQPFSLGICGNLGPGIAAYREAKRPGERLFTDFFSGSCMLLYEPQEKVFLDTRFDFYPTDFVEAVQGVLTLNADWRVFLDRWRISTVLVESYWPLASVLEEAPDYEVVFEDERAHLFRRVP